MEAASRSALRARARVGGAGEKEERIKESKAAGKWRNREELWFRPFVAHVVLFSAFCHYSVTNLPFDATV